MEENLTERGSFVTGTKERRKQPLIVSVEVKERITENLPLSSCEVQRPDLRYIDPG